MTVMLMFTFLLAAFGTTPDALTSVQSAVSWVGLMTDPLQEAAGRWMAFRLTDAQFGMLLWGLALGLVLPSVVYAALTAPIRPFVPVTSLCVWMVEATLVTYAVCEVRQLRAFVREKRWDRAARLIDG